MTPPSNPLDYVEWLSHLIIENGDSPNFTLGPLDQKRLARALLAVMPVFRAVERHRLAIAGTPHPSDSEVSIAVAYDQAIASMRRGMGEGG